MLSSRYHLISLQDQPIMAGAYVYAFDPAEFAWTQEGDWLLLFTDHPGILQVGARNYPYAPWTLFIIPPGYQCRIRPAAEGSPCGYWIRFRPSTEDPPIVAVPFISNLGEFGPLWERRMRTALNRAVQMRLETRVILTDILWSVAADPGSVRQNPALEFAEKYIEDHIDKPIRVEDLAQKAEISHNQLIRIFREEHGLTPIEYIRTRRQFHACRLLLETDLMIKQVASAVGVPDLAQFNRLVQSATGYSPREFRRNTRGPNIFRVPNPH